MKRRLFIAGNWKMNKSAAETAETITALTAALSSFDGSLDVALFPPFLSISAAQQAAAGSVVGIGSQNVHFAESGGALCCRVYDRYRLRCGNRIPGPAIVEEVDSTVVIHPGYDARVDGYGNLLIEEVEA